MLAPSSSAACQRGSPAAPAKILPGKRRELLCFSFHPPNHEASHTNPALPGAPWARNLERALGGSLKAKPGQQGCAGALRMKDLITCNEGAPVLPGSSAAAAGTARPCVPAGAGCGTPGTPGTSGHGLGPCQRLRPLQPWVTVLSPAKGFGNAPCLRIATQSDCAEVKQLVRSALCARFHFSPHGAAQSPGQLSFAAASSSDLRFSDSYKQQTAPASAPSSA